MSTQIEFGIAVVAYAVEDFWAVAKKTSKVMNFIRDNVTSIIKDTQENICLSGSTTRHCWEEEGGAELKELLDNIEEDHDDCYRIILCIFDETNSNEDWGSFMNHEFELYIHRELQIKNDNKEPADIPDGLGAMAEAVKDLEPEEEEGELDIMAINVEGCVDDALFNGSWSESHVSDWVSENVDSTDLMHMNDKETLDLAEDAYNDEFNYKTIGDGIDDLAVRALSDQVIAVCHDLGNEYELGDADKLQRDCPHDPWDRWDEVDQLYTVFGIEEDEYEVWHRVCYDLGDGGKVLWAEVTSAHPLSAVDMMRYAIEEGEDDENDKAA